MSKLPILRSDEKLPRGEFFYVQVGHRFYGGEVVDTVEVEVSTRQPMLAVFHKGGQPTREYQEHQNFNWGYFNRRARGARADKDRRKGTLAKYLESPVRKSKKIVNEFLGTTTPKLVDTLDQCKQFRKKDGALKACERLKGVYGELDIKIDVRYEGTSK